jgi:hypothetical protein
MGRDDRDSGFLWKDERKLVDAHATSSGSSDKVDEEVLADIRRPAETKSRMKGDIVSAEVLNETLEQVWKDLERIEMYHRRVRDQPGGSWEWSDKILPRVQSEVEKMSRLMESWEHEADREGRTRVREALSDALSPLHNGLDDLERALDSEFEAEDRRRARAGEKTAPEGLADDYRELKSRRAALLKLLKDAELRVIFQFIGVFEGKQLPERKKGGNNWKWWTSRYLKREYELVEESAWGYRLTERGELVDQVLWNLEKQPLLEMLGQGRMSTAEAALQLLPHHVGADRWDAWKDF